MSTMKPEVADLRRRPADARHGPGCGRSWDAQRACRGRRARCSPRRARTYVMMLNQCHLARRGDSRSNVCSRRICRRSLWKALGRLEQACSSARACRGRATQGRDDRSQNKWKKSLEVCVTVTGYSRSARQTAGIGVGTARTRMRGRLTWGSRHTRVYARLQLPPHVARERASRRNVCTRPTT
jgi:hypothetical protein